MVSGTMACVKYLLFLFNLIFAITGIVFISVGAVILVVYSGYKNFVDSWFFAAPVLMIIVGIVVFLVSFFGCCGAVKENHCMLITYSVLLMIIFALELGAGISGWVMRNEVDSMLLNRMNSTFYQYKSDEAIRRAWDILQYDFRCCGIDGPADWAKLDYTDNVIPDSCCTEISVGDKCDSNSVHSNGEGCMPKLQQTIKYNSLAIASVGIGIALTQLVGVTLACFLARSIRREYETV